MTPGQLRERPTAAGTQIEVPGYELVKVIGRGSYGTVYLGRSASGQWRAIKVCRRDERNVKDLDREWRGLQRYEPVSRSTPGFLAILDLGEDPAGEGFYCVMELADAVSGEAKVDLETYEPRTLAYELKTQGRLEVAEVLRLGITLGTALGRLHDSGLVHRDVKPANIVYVGGQPKLADMGLVVAEAEANSLVGTPGYIPPEGPGKPAGDIYALGKVLYQALTGYEPARFPDPPTFLREHQDPTRFQEVMDVLAKASEERSARRHGTAWETTEELELIQGGRSVRMLREARAQRARWRKWGIAATVLGIVGVVVALFAHRWSTLNQIHSERELAAMTSRSARLSETGDYGQALIDQAELVRRTEGTPEERLARLRYSMTLGQMPKLTALWAMGGAVAWCGFLPGDEQVLIALTKGGIQLRQVASGDLVREWNCEPVVMAAIDSGQARVVTAHDLSAQVWDLHTGKLISSFNHPAMVLSACFHPSGEMLLTMSKDGHLRWWNLRTASLEREIPAHPGHAGGLSIHPDGELIATGGHDRSVRFWRMNGEPIGGPWTLPHWVHQVWFSRDGGELVATCEDWNIYLWDVVGRQPLGPALPHQRAAGTAKFMPSGRMVVTCGRDGYLRFWEARTGKLERSMLRHRFPINTAGISSDGRRIVSGARDGTVRVWDLAGRISPTRLAPVVTSPEHRTMIVNGPKGFLEVDLQNPVVSARPVEFGPGAELVGVNDAGDRVLVSTRTPGRPGAITQLFEPGAKAPIGSSQSWESRSIRCAFVPHDRALALAASNRVALLSGDGQLRWTHDVEKAIDSLYMSPNGLLVAAAAGTDVYVWEVKVGRAVAEPRRHAMEVTRVVFSPDETRMIVCTGDSTMNEASAKVWSLQPGSETGRTPEIWHLDGIGDAAWLDGGGRIVTVSEDGTGRLWNSRTGQPEGDAMLHRNQATSVQLGPNGLLLTASWDRTARLWDGRTGRPFGPALPFPFELGSARWLPDFSGFVVRQLSRTAWWLQMPAITLSPIELAQLAKVMAGEAGPGQSGLEASADLAKAWQEIRQRHRNLFEVADDEIVAWCQFEAEFCQAESRSDAAIERLDQALVRRPADLTILERKRDFESRRRLSRASAGSQGAGK